MSAFYHRRGVGRKYLGEVHRDLFKKLLLPCSEGFVPKSHGLVKWWDLANDGVQTV